MSAEVRSATVTLAFEKLTDEQAAEIVRAAKVLGAAKINVTRYPHSDVWVAKITFEAEEDEVER